MGSRTRTTSLPCTWPGCPERGLFEYQNQRESAEIAKKRPTYRCTRHRNDECDVLQPAGHATLTTTLTVVDKEYGRYWHDGERTGSGFVYGPGFKAWAKDFPVGSVLTIVASVAQPNPATKDS